jgi:type IV pilus assembly protein PilB
MQDPQPIGEVLVKLGMLASTDYDRIVRLHQSNLGVTDILRQEGALDDVALEAYQKAKSEQPRSAEREILLGNGLVTEEQFLRAISTKHGIPYLEPDVSLVDKALLSKASAPYLARNKVLPFRMIDGCLSVIMADPLDRDLISEIERIYSCPIKPCGAPTDKITEALETLVRLKESGSAHIDTALQYHEIEEMPEDESSGEGAIRIVDHLLSQAIKMGASDLHLEPLRNKVRVRVRVDGSVRHLTDLPVDFTPRISSRVKVLASMDIAERRLHQDGRFYVRADGRDVDIRVSSYASMFGETIVMRLLDRRRGLIPLEGLGFQPRVLKLVKDLILRSSSGMLLVTGPTGSGKTTTMYSFVDHIKEDTLKIITCENPVEYILEGTTQCSVNEKTGPTFVDSLRAIVRQDPDIVVVGEIRDKATVGLATEAALTGHKVLSTFHTEDAVAAVVRLLEMGIEPFLVSSTLSCIVAQRLVRRICEKCRRPGEYSKRDLRYLGLTSADLQDMPVFEGAGCLECGGTGYRGRIGVHEVLMLDDDFRDAILRRPGSKQLRVLARNLPGFLTLQESGLLKVLTGETTLSEIADKVPRDPDARSLKDTREVAAIRRFR